MSHSRHTISYPNTASLKYTIWQGGPKVLLCFHGFGQDHSVYKSVYESLKETHTVYSFDLLFHGDTEWHAGDQSFLASDWFELIEAFLQQESIESFEVLGYSMGGKYAMITAQLFPAQTEHIRLISPDGISTHFSYRYSTVFMPMRKLLKAQITNPWAFKGIVNVSRYLKLQDNYTLRFAERQMDTEFKRAQVYHTWVTLRHFMPDLNALSLSVNKASTPLTFYLGLYDKIINRKEVKPLMDLIPHHQLVELESGHSTLIDEVAAVLKT